ncbi:MAG: DUF4080 domain-containing protein [Verrucomicrobiae bacterium]|nr:DUF4080 domain-containing protein [Verrucomicrobiae bacterium]
MPDILLATLNARYIHASFGLRYLLANLGELHSRTALLEFDIHQSPLEIVESILARHPRLVGLGVYIWNVRPTLEVVALLKRLRPEIRVVLGGPEVSHEGEQQEIVALADHTIAGEADLAFAPLCRTLLGLPLPDGTPAPAQADRPPRIVAAPLPDLNRLELPYDLYTDADLAHRVIYVEASRGCPFSCEFCLSSLDIPVRQFPLDRFLGAMGRLLDRGARQFKFVDRTFNLNLATSRAILRFFRERWRDGLFLHFEMIPDRLPEPLRQEIAAFPPGALQFEVGIQSFNPDVCARIQRRQDVARLENNLRFLRAETGVHVHADLIAGLPGETLDSFAAGFDRLVALGPQEIQFGILKRLRGTPIARHDHDWAMRYNPLPPYDILENRDLDFPTLQRLRRFARYWDLVSNSGRFPNTLPLVWADAASPFHQFLAWSDWLHAETGQTHAIALDRLARLLHRWLIQQRLLPPDAVRQAMIHDWNRLGRRDLPPWLAPEESSASSEPSPPVRPNAAGRHPARRQKRHLAGSSGTMRNPSVPPRTSPPPPE